MKGTSASHTLAIDLIPPRITKAVSTAIAMPVIHGATRNVSFTIAEMEFACTIFPMPNADTAVRMAKITPSHFCFMPLSRTYIGPPAINPSFVFMRYLTERSASEYFVAMPKTPVSHIQSTAPGPPAAIAVATPTMLPVPMVAASAVVSAPNWLMSPCPSGDF